MPNLETRLTLDSSQFNQAMNQSEKVADRFAQRTSAAIQRRFLGLQGARLLLGFTNRVIDQRKEIMGLSDEAVKGLDRMAEQGKKYANFFKWLWGSIIGGIETAGGGGLIAKFSELLPGAPDEVAPKRIAEMESRLKEAESKKESDAMKLMIERNDTWNENRLKQIEDKKKAQDDAPEVTAIHAARIQADALASIGGFVGAGPDRPAQIMQSQLVELKQITANTKKAVEGY